MTHNTSDYNASFEISTIGLQQNEIRPLLLQAQACLGAQFARIFLQDAKAQKAIAIVT